MVQRKVIVHTIPAVALSCLLGFTIYVFRRVDYPIPESMTVPRSNYLDGRHSAGLYTQSYLSGILASTRTASVIWLIWGCGDLASHSYSTPRLYAIKAASDCSTPPNIAFNVSFDGSAIANGTYYPHSPYIDGDVSGSGPWLTRTARVESKHRIDWDPRFGYGQIYAYPFDVYSISTQVRITGSITDEPLPFLAVDAYDTTDSFFVDVTLNVDVMSPANDLQTGSHTSTRALRLKYKRTTSQKVFVLTLFLGNWMLAFLVACIAAQSLFSKDRVSESMLFFPTSAAAIIPVLRAMWPNAPLTGLFLDTCGTVPQMAIIVAAFLTMLWGRRHRPTRDDAQADLEMTETSDSEPCRPSHGRTHHVDCPVIHRGPSDNT